MSRRRYRKSHPVRNFILTLLIVLAAGVVILWKAGPLKQKVAQKVSTQLMETAADSAASKIAEASGGAISAEAAKQEIIRRYLNALARERRNDLDSSESDKIDLIMKSHGISVSERKVYEVSNRVSEERNCPAAAIELDDGTIITGKTND